MYHPPFPWSDRQANLHRGGERTEGRKVTEGNCRLLQMNPHKKLTFHLDRDCIILRQSFTCTDVHFSVFSLTCIFQFSHKRVSLTPLFCVRSADDCADCRGFPPDCSCEDYQICKSQGCDTGECQPDCPGRQMLYDFSNQFSLLFKWYFMPSFFFFFIFITLPMITKFCYIKCDLLIVKYS